MSANIEFRHSLAPYEQKRTDITRTVLTSDGYIDGRQCRLFSYIHYPINEPMPAELLIIAMKGAESFIEERYKSESPNQRSKAMPLDKEENDKIYLLISEHLGITPIEDGQRFSQDLGADSLDRIELFMAFEEEFHIEISEDEGKQCITIGDAKRLITDKIALCSVSKPVSLFEGT